ncbi:18249_t:CDS:2 [Acaulospora morrowiae]|uniref:18249_t:CDS:1 n=1 Tax=Acaulospora morrowiae TaxID=94023 RepID=A0A9N8VZ66_9GLOM|nr:18249_t:CDS:2 [Acaulospora morrowiae]
MRFYNLGILTVVFLANISYLVSASRDTPFVKGVYFDRIITVVLGSSSYDVSMQDSYLSSLAQEGISLTNFHAIWHPAQPNYFAMICASKGGVLTDFTVDVDGPSLPNLLEASGVSWKAYIENYPGNDFTGDNTKDELYYRKYNPFISMNEIRNNHTLVSKIVNADEFVEDIAKESLPQYVFYTPNTRNSGHLTDLSYASNYLRTKFIPLIKPVLTNSRTLLVITFDESTYFDHFNLKKYNQIYTVLIGPNVLTSYIHVDELRYNHYSILPTIQLNWNLTELGTGDDKKATPLSPYLFL